MTRNWPPILSEAISTQFGPCRAGCVSGRSPDVRAIISASLGGIPPCSAGGGGAPPGGNRPYSTRGAGGSVPEPGGWAAAPGGSTYCCADADAATLSAASPTQRAILCFKAASHPIVGVT